VNTSPPSVRLAHFSDVHVTSPACVWRGRDYLSKRLSAWVNLRFLGRGRRFRHAEAVLYALRTELRQGHFDHLVFSGDATAMGFEQEMARAANLIGVGGADVPPGIAVPGNHDYLTHHDVSEAHFERYFAPWQEGRRVDDAIYPFAQRVGHVWLVAVNSSVPNRRPWDATGIVGPNQLARLERLLGTLEPGPRILVTHYPVRRANGQPERSLRALRDLSGLLEVASRGGIGLWLHGHRHDTYYHAASDHAPFPVICAGSLTQRRHWSFSDYTLTETTLTVRRRVYHEKDKTFQDGKVFEIKLRAPDGIQAETARIGGGSGAG
jgi:3',5'-cyclic AMP phosphodiesterase CpdA